MSLTSCPTVFIAVETKARELDGKLLLTANLLNRQIRVAIGSRKGIFRELRHFKNGAFIAKSISEENSTQYRELVKNGNLLTVLNVEGGVFYKDDTEDFIHSYPTKITDNFSYIFLFGEQTKKSFLRVFHEFEEKKLLVSGDPRFDLLKEKYLPFFLNSIREIEKDFSPFILVNTSFGLTNPYVGFDKLFEFMKKNVGYKESILNNLKMKSEVLAPVLEEYIETIKEISKCFDEINFVVRPHPSELPDTYIQAFSDCSNVYVTNENNVYNWILASEAVVHYDCTTGIEAVLAGKPTISYVPMKNEAVFAWLPAYVSLELNKKKQLKDTIHKILEKEQSWELSKKRKSILNAYIANVEISSSDVIATLMERELLKLPKGKYCKIVSLCWQRNKSQLKSMKSSLEKKKKKSITEVKFDRWTKEELREKVTLLSKIEGFENSFKLKKLGSDVYLFIP